jgi:hypothetical protein
MIAQRPGWFKTSLAFGAPGGQWLLGAFFVHKMAVPGHLQKLVQRLEGKTAPLPALLS